MMGVVEVIALASCIAVAWFIACLVYPAGEDSETPIELRERVKTLTDEIELLRAERDDARREICQLKGTVRCNHYFTHFDPKGYAENRGWDCFKEDSK